MKLRTDIALQPAAPDAEGGLRSLVLCGGRGTGLVLTGSELRAAVGTPAGTVLFVAYGDPFEESLTITLAGPDWQVLDEATLAASGASGSFEDLVLMQPNAMSFRFFGNRRMILTAYERPRLTIPLDAFGLGLQRPFQWRRWFRLRAA